MDDSTRLLLTARGRKAERETTLPVQHGHGLGAVFRCHALAAFFVLAYVFSWSYWLALALAGGSGSHFPGLLGPLLAAFTVTFVNQGRRGAGDLLSRMFRWRVRLRWYAAALVPAVAGAAAVAVLAVAENRWPTLDDLSTMPGLPAAGFWALLAMVLVINGYGEEVGWRGFAWTRLRERHSIAGAAALLGIVWAGWHLPVFWLDTGMRNLDWFVIPGWIIGLMAGAVVLGWLYERASSSLLIVAILHTMLNVASATLATEGLPAAAATTVVIIWAIVILRRERSRPEPGPYPLEDRG
ncbi:MAG TPA: type II CAAX endopeptidase family protein [Acidimicrobiia bacterium]|nr:type II CAAX endopeptidase family protein [Acidimicrobiia bacterium]